MDPEATVPEGTATVIDTPETGDVFDEDTGEFLGTLNLDVEDAVSIKPVLPAQIALFYEGYFYIFKPQSKYKSEEGEKQP